MSAPDLTLYRAVHQALRGGASGLAEAAGDIQNADDRRRKAFVRYWKGYEGEVLGHHTVEDDHFFPALVERVPVAGELIERTAADHQHLDELMEAISRDVAAVAHGGPAGRLPGLTRELDQHMVDHLDFEDRDILPLFERHFDAEEYEALNDAAMKSVGVGRQAAFSVPFVVAALTPEQAGAILPTAPMGLRIVNRLFQGPHARLTQRAFGHPLVGVS